MLRFVRSFANLLQPKNRLYRKAHKGRVPVRTGGSIKGSSVAFGEYGIRVKDGTRITAAQIDACMTQIKRNVKQIKGAKVYLRVFPDIPVTKKPLAVRMGKGKGEVDHFMCRVPKDKILFEVSDMRSEIALSALKSVKYMLPVKTHLVVRKKDSISIQADKEREKRFANEINRKEAEIELD